MIEYPSASVRAEGAGEPLSTLRQRYGMALKAYIANPQPEKWRRLIAGHVAYRLAAFCKGETK